MGINQWDIQNIARRFDRSDAGLAIDEGQPYAFEFTSQLPLTVRTYTVLLQPIDSVRMPRVAVQVFASHPAPVGYYATSFGSVVLSPSEWHGVDPDTMNSIVVDMLRVMP